MILSLDWGLKKVGVATSDDQGIVITPRPLWIRRQAAQLWSFNTYDKEDLQALVSQHQPSLILMGLPLNADGSPSNSSELAKKLGSKISSQFEIPVEMIPEQLSSWESRHKENEDSHAAGLFIESYFFEKGIQNK